MLRFSAGIVGLAVLSGCSCGAPLFPYERNPNTVSYDIGMPLELVVAQNRTQINVPVEVTNTSTAGVCFGSKSNDRWLNGLEPRLSLRPGPGDDIFADLSSAELIELSATEISQGETVANRQTLFIPIKLKETARSGQSADLDWSFIVVDPKNLESEFQNSSGTISVQIRSRPPSLIAEPTKFPSEF